MNVGELLEPHRPGLTGHCYRMLGSAVEADDAVQETMLRAWKSYQQFDGRSAMSTWLYRIATNICLDQLRVRKRRELPTAAGPVGSIDDELVGRPPTHWLEPIPDARALPRETSCPEHRAELRQSLRLAFVAALQQLPAKQRAALLLKDVLGFSTAEIAETLESSPASINSALQRARAALATQELDDRRGQGELSTTQRELVERYVDAFHSYDVDAIVALLRDDASLSMPPMSLWLRGHASIRAWLLGRGIGCRGSRLIATAACGSVAFAQYRAAASGHRAWSLIVLDLDDDHITSMIHFLDVELLFPLFDLPLELPPTSDPTPNQSHP